MSLRECVKNIFKIYAVTVASVLLAAGVTFGVVVSAITNSLNTTAKVLGNGLKEIGIKVASILSGLLGTIFSFLFRTAGQAIGFLAEHAWLLILAVVAFLLDRYTKKRYGVQPLTPGSTSWGTGLAPGGTLVYLFRSIKYIRAQFQP